MTLSLENFHFPQLTEWKWTLLPMFVVFLFGIVTLAGHWSVALALEKGFDDKTDCWMMTSAGKICCAIG